MLVNLTVDFTPVEAGEYSECQALVKALDYYKCNVALNSDNPTLSYALDSLQHKITLALVDAVEQLSNTAGEAPFA